MRRVINLNHSLFISEYLTTPAEYKPHIEYMKRKATAHGQYFLEPLLNFPTKYPTNNDQSCDVIAKSRSLLCITITVSF